MEFLLTWLLYAAAFYLVAAVLPGMRVSSFGGAVFVAAVYGILNVLIGWFLWLALGVVSLGLLWFIDFLRIWIAGAIVLRLTDLLTDRLTIRDFFPTTLIAAALMAVIASAGGVLIDRLLGG